MTIRRSYELRREHRIKETERELKTEKFSATVNNSLIPVVIIPDISGYGWYAFSEEMTTAHSMKSREDAVLQLVAKIEEQ